MSSHSKPILWNNTERKKLESCEAKIINHLIYGDNAGWGNSKQTKANAEVVLRKAGIIMYVKTQL